MSKRKRKSKKHRKHLKRDPRTGRKTVYLGHRVPDTGKPGLDNVNEVRGICKAILEDYKKHRISYRTAMSRLNLLKLIVKKDHEFRGKREAYEIIDRFREKLEEMKR